MVLFTYLLILDFWEILFQIAIQLAEESFWGFVTTSPKLAGTLLSEQVSQPYKTKHFILFLKCFQVLLPTTKNSHGCAKKPKRYEDFWEEKKKKGYFKELRNVF